ncbi:hypothetical protein N9V60_03980 [Flavobacteriaceae bacterium]|nr:hypothetical protein [Flavobacteriaceae bacterium]MDB2340623.1 hypothetical protein [Flavobacteriaceae bacterium]
MNYTEKKEKIESVLNIVLDVDNAEDMVDETPEDYIDLKEAQQVIWGVLKTMSYEEIQKLADEFYSCHYRMLELLAHRGTRQAFAISTLTRRYLELEAKHSRLGSPKIIDLNAKVEEDPFGDLPF